MGSSSTECEGDLPDYDDLVEEYISSTKLKLLFIFILFAIFIVSAIFSMTAYGGGMSVKHVIDMLIGHFNGEEYPFHSEDWFDSVIIWETATPRLLFTILAGIGRAIAGASMQSTMNNPLADPYTVGVSAGACLGLAVALVLGFSINTGGIYAIITFSFLFAMFPLVAIIILAPRTRSSPATLILAGVALSYLFNSVNTIILVTSEAETLESIYVWQVGTFERIHWANLPLATFAIGIGSVVILLLSRKLNLLVMGDASASSLVIDPDNLRIICLIAIAFIVGAIVGSAGVIGFVGLVTPHIVRTLLGSDNRYVLPAAALLSITILLVSDTICRSLGDFGGIPVGTIVSLIGAPVFLYLILRRNSRVW